MRIMHRIHYKKPPSSSTSLPPLVRVYIQLQEIMGIGTAIKDALKGNASDAGDESRSSGYHLPPGTGIGTTGKPPTAAQQAAEKSTVGAQAGHDARVTVLDNIHPEGHSKAQLEDLMPSDQRSEDTNQLKPVTHEHVRHMETEEVLRVKDRERHIHHIQHHTQPITASEELEEKHHENIHPVTVVHERHSNKPEEKTLFEGQIRQHRNIVEHGAKERTVVDQGMMVNEHVYHHIHHVVQPIIEKETIDKHRIHTTIPIHEVTHEAPIVHQSQRHDPVPVEDFLERGGTLTGAIPYEQISAKILHGGQCTRDVDGVAYNLENELRLGPGTKSSGADQPHVSGRAPEQLEIGNASVGSTSEGQSRI
ncbi:hypothetical protein AX17_005496 [Amanita inopinata Kibby_2008]|nr:hypothetical protein AX17_005496 [Amanita inopinata Kibby_2008]